MVNGLIKKSTSVLNLRQTNILSAAVVIMLTVLLSAFLGLIRIRLLSGFFGDSRTLDIFWAAFRLPDMLFQILVMGTLSSAFIPVFSSYLGKNNTSEAFKISNSVITIASFFFFALSLFLIIFADTFSRFLAPGFNASEIQLMVSLTRIMFLGQIFFLIGNFLTGILQSFHHFLLPALAPVMYNLGIILGTLFLTPLLGIYGPTLGVILGTFLFLLIQIPLAVKLGWRFKPSLDYRNTGVREVGRLMVPRTLSFAVSQIEYSVDLMIASLFAPGHYTIFTFALFLINLPVRLFGATIGQASLPTLSLNYAQDNLVEFKKTLTNSFQQIIYLVLPASIILLVLRIPLVRLAFGSKYFSWEATLLTGKMVGFLTLAVIAQSLTQLLIRAFYALHDTKTPFSIGFLAVLVNVATSIFLAIGMKMGVLGLAISTSVSSIFNSLILLSFLVKKLGLVNSDNTVSFFKKVAATGIMAVILFLFQRILDLFVFDTTKTLNLILLTTITLTLGISTYLYISKLLVIEETETYLAIFLRLKNWRQILSRNEELITETSQATQAQNI